VQFYKNGHISSEDDVLDGSICHSRVRQFIEMVNGTDSEVRCLGGRSPKSQDSYPGSPRLFNSPVHKASSSQAYQTGMCTTYTLKRFILCLLISSASMGEKYLTKNIVRNVIFIERAV